MKMLYKYPQHEFLIHGWWKENKKRSKHEPEFELMDTGIFNDDKYFDVFIEYAKQNVDDVLIAITVCNRGNEDADLNIIPTLWFATPGHGAMMMSVLHFLLHNLASSISHISN